MRKHPSALAAAILCAPFFLSEARAQIPTGVDFMEMPGMAFQKPVYFGEMPGKTNHFVVLEQHGGRVMLCKPAGSSHSCQEILKVSVRQDIEMGLLGFAYHPEFQTNRKYYLHYNPGSGSRRTLIEERRFNDDFTGDSGDSPRKIFEMSQPASNHNAGQILFGPDGYFYIPLGDGGGSNRTPQNPKTFYGSILRVDVDNPEGDKGYGIPDDNPFLDDSDAAPETFAYGFRNPYKSNFDALTGELWVGDVGDNDWEEINIAKAGENYGWNREEGFCNCSDYAEPVTVISSDSANAIVGGQIFRADPNSAFYGVYVFADYVQSHVWGMRMENGKEKERRHIGKAPDLVSSVEMDSRGNLYVVGYSGKIYKLVHSELKPVTTATPSPQFSASGPFLSILPGGSWALSPQWKDIAQSLTVRRLDGSVEAVFRGSALASGILELPHAKGMRLLSLDAGEARITQRLFAR